MRYTWLVDRLGRLAFLYAALVLLPSCHTLFEPTYPATVLERNKSMPPAWLRLQGGRLHRDEETWQFVYSRRGLVDLRLGLRQAEAQARQASLYALHEALLAEARAAYRSNERSNEHRNEHRNEHKVDHKSGHKKAAWGQELTSKLAKKINAFHQLHSQVGDVYYERRFDRDEAMGYHYDVHVLIHTRMPDLAAFLKDLQAEWQNNKRA